MKRPTVSSLILDARDRAALTPKAAAKLVGVTPHYLTHLEQPRPAHPVHLSDELALKLIKKLKVSRQILLVKDAHNKRATRYNREYFKRKARR